MTNREWLECCKTSDQADMDPLSWWEWCIYLIAGGCFVGLFWGGIAWLAIWLFR